MLARIVAAEAGAVEEAIEALESAHPDWGPDREGRARARADLSHHVGHVEAAIDSGEPEVFRRYARWLVAVYESRGVPRRVAIDSFEILADALARRLPRKEAEEVRSVLAEGARAAAEASGPGEAEPLGGRAEAAALVDALLAGDGGAAHGLISGLLHRGMSRPAVMDEVIRPAMYEIGRLWQENRITVAMEHLATGTIAYVLSVLSGVPRGPRDASRRAVVACVAGNEHALGGQIVAAELRERGWFVDYLGANVPTAALVAHVVAARPKLLGLSVSLPVHVIDVRRAIDAIRAALGDEAPRIIVGGLPLREYADIAEGIDADAWAEGAADLDRAMRA